MRRAVADAISRTQLTVYISYAYPDNKDDFVARLSNVLAQELRLQTGDEVAVLWDMARTSTGAIWSSKTEEFISRTTVLVPLLSPSYFKSKGCQRELELFAQKYPTTNRLPICPVYFVTANEVENAAAQPQTALIHSVQRRQFIDFRLLRFDPTSKNAQRSVFTLATSIRGVHEQSRNPTPARVSSDFPESAKAPEPVYVEELLLENFRCFEFLKLHLDRPSSLAGRWTCIAGINGSGKSTILQALGLGLLGNPLAFELGGDRLRRMRRRSTPAEDSTTKIEVVLKDEGGLRSHRSELMIGETGSIESLNSSLRTGVRPLLVAGYGATRNLSARPDSGIEHLSADVRHQITLFDPLSQLAGAEVLLGHESVAWPFSELFRTAVQQIFETDLEIVLSGSASGIRFVVSKKDSVEAIDLPDGFRSAAAWIADLCSAWCERAPALAQSANPADVQGIVLIDEIDLHLHPRLQRELVPRLRKTFPKTQWIVTTHSPLVLGNFDASEIIALDRNSFGGIREIDRQILGFTSDQIYEWLMDTPPIGAQMEEKLQQADEGSDGSHEEVARLMRVSPTVTDEAAQKQVEDFQEILKSLRR